MKEAAFCTHSMTWRTALAVAAFAGLIAIATSVWAGPGAHGPGGEHLDQPAAASAAALPRVEANTDQFELVAALRSGELVILVDRYETNEPVLAAALTVESGGVQAPAKFRGDRGDYAVDDPKLLQRLAAPGEHALVFTLVHQGAADLLDGTLRTPDSSRSGHKHSNWAEVLIGGAAILAVVVGGLLLWRRRTARARLAAVAIAAGALSLLAGSVMAGPGAHGPGGEHLDAPAAAANASGLARLPDGSVNVPKDAQRRMGIRTVLAPESQAAGTVELSGRVVIDPNAGGRVQALHGGRIEPGPRGLPVAGQAVRRGEVLAYVRHHAEPFALGNQQAQLAELRAQRLLAEQRVQRLASLEGTVPRKEIDAARAEAHSLAQREQSVGGSITAREALVAPATGVIARADAVVGQVVEARDVLFEVIDPARVMIEAVTADSSLPGRIAGATLQDVPVAQLRLIGAARSLRDGMLPVTFAVRADKSAALPLAVGQPVTVIVALDERIKGIVLPAQAVVRNPTNEPVVWIKSGAERFIPQPVRFRPLDAQTVVVTGGLGVDNRVVVQGAPLIAQIR
jgi:biotin carboxyl carrier protein